MSNPRPYLEPAGFVTPTICDWCDNMAVCQPLYHGDLNLLDLCAKCMAQHVYSMHNLTRVEEGN